MSSSTPRNCCPVTAEQFAPVLACANGVLAELCRLGLHFHEALDAWQDIQVYLLRHPAVIERFLSCSRYCWRVVQNQARLVHRRHNRGLYALIVPAPVGELPVARAQDPHEDVRLRDLLEVASQRLTGQERLVFAALLEGCTNKEIGKRLACGRDRVTRLCLAVRDRLGGLFAAAGLSPPAEKSAELPAPPAPGAHLDS